MEEDTYAIPRHGGSRGTDVSSVTRSQNFSHCTVSVWAGCQSSARHNARSRAGAGSAESGCAPCLFQCTVLRGKTLVSEVLNDTALKAQWLAEVDTIRSRIAEMRTVLVNTLKTHCRRRTLIIFCISAGCSVTPEFSPEQVTALREQHAGVSGRFGRVCMAR